VFYTANQQNHKTLHYTVNTQATVM